MGPSPSLCLRLLKVYIASHKNSILSAGSDRQLFRRLATFQLWGKPLHTPDEPSCIAAAHEVSQRKVAEIAVEQLVRNPGRGEYELYDPLDPAQVELRQISARIHWYEKRVSKRTTARYRFRREHPEERELHEKHHSKGTTVAVARRYARRYRVLAEELAARGISLDERRG